MVEYGKASLADVKEMQALVKPFVDDGTILLRSDDEVANTIRSYTVAREKGSTGEGKIVGFSALYIYSPSLGEIRSLVVAPAHHGRGIGAGLVRAAMEEGRALGLEKLLALTFAKGFFEKLGFTEVDKEELPHSKIWEDCIKCKHFPVCNESALILKL